MSTRWIGGAVVSRRACRKANPSFPTCARIGALSHARAVPRLSLLRTAPLDDAMRSKQALVAAYLRGKGADSSAALRGAMRSGE